MLILLLFLAGCGDINFIAAFASKFKSHKYVLIVAGQSNAVGHALNSSADPEIVGHIYHRTKIWVSGAWKNLDPVNNQSNPEQSQGIYHGIEPYLARLFEHQFPDDELYIIKFAADSTRLASDPDSKDWAPSSGELYTVLKNDYLSPALASPELSSGYVPFGFWWMQGESDTGDFASALDYLSNLSGFFSALSTDIPDTADFPRFIGRIRPNTHWTYQAEVREAQAAFCFKPNNNAILIDTDYAEVSDAEVHYSPAGYDKISRLLFGALLLKFVAPGNLPFWPIPR